MRVHSTACLLLLALGAAAQLHRVAPPAPWVEQLPIDDLVMRDTACSSGGTQYLLADRQYHLGREESYFRLVTKLISPEAVQNGSRIEVDVDPSYQQLVLHTVRVIRNGRPIDKLASAHVTVLQRERDLNAFLYDGTRSVVIEMHDIRPGDIIDHSFTIKGNDAASDGRFSRLLSMGHSIPLARHHVRFIIPAGRKPIFRKHGFDELAVQREGRWGAEHIWDRRDLPCIIPESDAPGWYMFHPQLEVSEFSDLEALRAWAIDQFSVDMKLGGELQAVVDRLLELDEPFDRIDSAIGIVQREVRYLGLEEGISAYRPRPPARVYAQRFGDCKDRSLLLVAMLRAMGMDAWPALVSTTDGRMLGGFLPRPSMFDHCITMIEHDGGRFWVDPTTTHNRGPLADRYTADMGLALVVGEEGKGWTEMGTDEMGSAEVHEKFTLDVIGGGAVLEVESRYERREADRLRAWLAGRSVTGVTEEYRDYYRSTWHDLSVLDPVRWEDDVARNVLHTYERYALENVWDTLDDGGRSVEVFPEVLKGYMAVPKLRVRQSPLLLGSPVDVVHRITLNMPEPWEVTAGTQAIEGFGVMYKSTVEGSGAEVRLTYRYRSDSLVVHAADMPAFHAQQQRILDDLGMTFTHHGTGDGISSWDKVQAYGALLAMLALGIWGGWRLYRWDPPPHPEAEGQRPATIGGWMVLPMIGLVLSPLRLLYEMLSDDAWFLRSALHVPFMDVPHPGFYMLYIHFSQLVSILMLCLAVVTIVLFFKRRSSVPFLMKAIYLITVLSQMMDLALYEALSVEAYSGEAFDTRDIGRSIFSAIIWVPFFHLSERVQTTFVKRLPYDPGSDRAGPQDLRPGGGAAMPL